MAFLRFLTIALVSTLLLACHPADRHTPPSPTPAATVANAGPDTDGDGIADANDRCPGSKEDQGRWGSDANDGCPGTLDDLLNIAASDLNSFWEAQFKGQRVLYEPPLRFEGYTRPIETGCGESARNNAFYCSADHAIYYDKDFLQTELDDNGDFEPVMIIAHEWGHLIQETVGELQSSQVLPIELELQADCLAGAWAADADRRGLLEQGDLEEAMTALVKAGDPSDEPFAPDAHGTANERMDAFRAGFDRGVPGCALARSR